MACVRLAGRQGEAMLRTTPTIATVTADSCSCPQSIWLFQLVLTGPGTFRCRCWLLMVAISSNVNETICSAPRRPYNVGS